MNRLTGEVSCIEELIDQIKNTSELMSRLHIGIRSSLFGITFNDIASDN